jgi:hypothetical protein
MPDDDAPSRGNLWPTLILVLLVLALIGGVWLFPPVSAYMAQQDCIASGHTNCAPFH